MKKLRLITKTLLVAAMLLGGGNFTWAVTYNATVTGVVGATDNSSGFNVVGSKEMSLAAGDEYVITFVNNNKGTDGTNYWANWAFCSNVFNCRADHGDSNPYWGSATNVNYSGKSWTEISSIINEWLQAYNGVTVTLTVSRNAAGDGIEITHSATTKAVGSIESQEYEGTFTATVDASSEMTFYLTVENAHLLITKVIRTRGDKATIFVAPEHTAGAQWGSNTGVSTVDAEKEHYNGDGGSGWSGCAYAKFSYGEIPDGVTITEALVTYSVNQGGNYGRNDIIYYMSQDFDLDWTTFAGQTGTDLRNTSYRAGKAVEAAATGGKGDRLNLEQSVVGAVQSIYNVGQKYILFQWTGNAGGADLYGKGSTAHAPQLEIGYTSETRYTATFTENNSLTPTVTIYSDAEMTSTVTNGTLTNGTKYYFKAVLTGYVDYTGDFTVNGANPVINFTMMAKQTFSYTVRAVDGSSNVLKEELAKGTAYEGDNLTLYWSKYINVSGQWYVTNLPYGGTYTESGTTEITYTPAAIYDFIECESMSYSSAGDYVGTSYSGGSAVLLASGKAMTSKTKIAAGVYDISVYNAVRRANEDLLKLQYSTDNSTWNDVTTLVFEDSRSDTKTAEKVNLAADSYIRFLDTKGQNSCHLYDYILIKKSTVTATIAASGYTTLSSAYGLDFSGVEGLTAYVVSNSTKSAVTISSVDEMPANSGVVLRGTASTTYSIPVKAGATFSGNNKLQAAVTATVVDNNDAYILMGGKFCLLTGAATVADRTIPAGKAYLLASDVPNEARTVGFVFDDELTGIDNVNVNDKLNGEFYDLQGRRVAAPQKGLYIMNGRKVIVK